MQEQIWQWCEKAGLYGGWRKILRKKELLGPKIEAIELRLQMGKLKMQQW